MSIKSIFSRKISPFTQAGLVIALMLLLMFIAYLTEQTGISKKDEMTPWIMAIAMLMFYSMLNCVLSLSAKDQGNYWWKSVASFFLVALTGILISWAISGISLFESKSLGWIFIVFTFVYFVLISILSFMRRIVSFAEKQDKRLRGED